VVLTQIFWPIPGALSLSLPSSSSAKERRGQGELHLDDRVQPPNCHFWLTCPLPPVYRPPCPKPFSSVFICIIILVYYILTSFTDTPFQRAGLKRSLKRNGRHPFVYIIFIYLFISFYDKTNYITIVCDVPLRRAISQWLDPASIPTFVTPSPRHAPKRVPGQLTPVSIQSINGWPLPLRGRGGH